MLSFNPHVLRPLIISHTPKVSRSTVSSNTSPSCLSQNPVTSNNLSSFSAILNPSNPSIAVEKKFIPLTFKEAMLCPDKDKWKEAIQSELSALKENGTWTIVHIDTLPTGSRPIGGKWVFDIKYDGRYKARFVAKGFSQRYGRDYKETFAPVINSVSLRLLLTIAAQQRLRVRQFDIPNAFLKGILKEPVFMYQPEGHVESSSLHVCKLLKTIYGLKQASKEFYDMLKLWLISIGFSPLHSDPCVYLKKHNKDVLYVGTHVDDGVHFGTCPKMVADFEHQLSKRFKVISKDVDNLLGMTVSQSDDNSIIQVHLKDYILDLLENNGMLNCKPVSTPIDPSVKLIKEMSPLSAEDQLFLKKSPFLSTLMSLSYLAVHNRPDISFAVNQLHQFSSDPRHEHVMALKRILRYLKGTIHFKLVYQYSSLLDGKNNLLVVGYSDSDWASCLDSRRSTTGYVFMIGRNLISWSSRRQKVVSLSSTEAEYYAMTATAAEAKWLRAILNELGFPQWAATLLYGDNQGCLHLSKHVTNHQRTKHIDIKHHFIRDLVLDNVISLLYIPTEDMIADVMTKGLPSNLHRRCISKLSTGFNLQPELIYSSDFSND